MQASHGCHVRARWLVRSSSALSTVCGNLSNATLVVHISQPLQICNRPDMQPPRRAALYDRVDRQSQRWVLLLRCSASSHHVAVYWSSRHVPVPSLGYGSPTARTFVRVDANTARLCKRSAQSENSCPVCWIAAYCTRAFAIHEYGMLYVSCTT
jgi:hypothetical protein